MNKQVDVSDIERSIALLQENKQAIIKAFDDQAKADQAEASKKSRAEIDQLVQKYNREEGEQGQRLARLFNLIKQRKGLKRVVFSNGDMWTDWKGPDRLDAGLHIQRLDRSITEIIPGE